MLAVWLNAEKHIIIYIIATNCKCYNWTNTQVETFQNVYEDGWEIPRSEIELGDKLGQGNYGAVLKGQLTVTAMTPKIHTYKKEMDFERKSHLTVAVKMFRCKLNLHMVHII